MTGFMYALVLPVAITLNGTKQETTIDSFILSETYSIIIRPKYRALKSKI